MNYNLAEAQKDRKRRDKIDRNMTDECKKINKL